VFAAILALFFLKAKLYRHHYLSIMAVVVGLIFVGLSEALNGSDSSSSNSGNILLLGIGM
jgi:drug/metabolite transporter (DMT)-like permease